MKVRLLQYFFRKRLRLRLRLRLQRLRMLYNMFLSLIKFAISFFVGLSAFAGSVMFSHKIGLPALLSFFGVFVLAAGCSVLNQFHKANTQYINPHDASRFSPALLAHRYSSVKLPEMQTRK